MHIACGMFQCLSMGLPNQSTIPVYAHYLQKGGMPFVSSTVVMLVMVVYQLGCMNFCSFVV